MLFFYLFFIDTLLCVIFAHIILHLNRQTISNVSSYVVYVNNSVYQRYYILRCVYCSGRL
jgi:hypothetical protein